MYSYGALGRLHALSRQGRLQIVPCNYSALPRLFADGSLPRDVGLIQVSSPDADGMCSLGIGVDYAADAIPHTPVLIAEINKQMPATQGAPKIPIDRLSAFVETDRALPEGRLHVPDDCDRMIAQHVAGLIEDGDTIQSGIGALPSAVLDALRAHTNLGLHSGMISDAALRLLDAGVITGAKKEIDLGMVVTGAALGGAELYRRVADLPVAFRPASYTHAPETLAQLRSFVAVNAAIEVDLTGQIGAEIRRGVYVGAIGGQADFSRAAACSGARSIIAVRSQSRGQSTIKPVLAGGLVTTPRTDVDFIATEHGVASLRGASLAERTQRITAIAAPEHREALERASRRPASRK